MHLGRAATVSSSLRAHELQCKVKWAMAVLVSRSSMTIV